MLTAVERERDTWQRPDDVLAQLDLRPGDTVVDLGSGAGYFALKIAPRVARTAGCSRSIFGGSRWPSCGSGPARRTVWNHPRHSRRRRRSQAARPDRSTRSLIANTYHELTAPEPVLRGALASRCAPARGWSSSIAARATPARSREAAAHHEMTAAAAEREIRRHGFLTVTRDDRFIDRPADEDVWWLHRVPQALNRRRPPVVTSSSGTAHRARG